MNEDLDLIKEEKKKQQIEKKKAQFQNMLQDVTIGKGKDTLGGKIKIWEKNQEIKETYDQKEKATSKVYLTNRRDVLPVAIDLIEINPINKEFFQPLRDSEWEEFKADISERGIIQPLIAYLNPINKRWILIDGEQRYRAALELKLKTLPIQTTEKPAHKELERQFLIKANLLRRQLNDSEKKKLYRALSKEERLNLYLEKYGPEKILSEERGGDQKSTHAKSKLLSKSPNDNFDNTGTLKQQILNDTLLPEGTVNRDLAQLRKKLKDNTAPNPKNNLDQKSRHKLEKINQEIEEIEKKIQIEETIFQTKIMEIRNKKNEKIKSLKKQRKEKENELKQILH
jgi:ParB-like chromosome segregation protein Spo0J